jgi:c-di-GMP-binding flagellar brake protein YcgR
MPERDSGREKRKLQRRKLIYYLQVLNRQNDELLGRLVDITTEGLMLISDQPIPTPKVFPLKMLLPAQNKPSREIRCDAKAVWSKRDVNPDLYATGFQFVDVSPRDVQSIENLVQDYELPD